ncbi:MAG: hypothetical protein Q7K29_09655 [Thermoleophilia bacterium]|nr:hypothetical protein [Thermoleophilia bacterium]
MKDTTKKKIFLFSVASVALIACAWIAIPTASISPGDIEKAVPLGQPVSINSSPLAAIGKVAVYADDQQLALEYNLGSGDLSRDFQLKPGQSIRIEAKISSVIGLTREFTSTFTTVEPVTMADISVNGSRMEPGQKIPPQPTLTFSFSKPLSSASVSLDGSDAIELQIDPEDPTVATLPPTVSLKQGATHLMNLTATAVDTATLDSREVRASVVRPLSLYGSVTTVDGQTKIELDSTAAFGDPAAVRAALSTTLPSPEVVVDKQKILITCASLEPGNDYTIKLASALGGDGSFLEAPLEMNVTYRSDPSAVSPSGNTGYRGYVYTSGGTSSGSASGSGGAPADSGPPPGWPSCCPWPPQ